jgi:hypothetical protein
MKIPRIQSLMLVFFFALYPPAIVRADDDDASPPAKILPVTPEIEAAAAKAMKDCPPQGTTIHEGINTNGVYTLTGDLFKNGQTNALIDNQGNIILCEWQGNQWKTKEAIGVPTIWNSHGIIPEEERSGEIISANKPFWILALQCHPLLVVPSTPEKYGQCFSVFLIDSKSQQILDTTSSYQSEPIIKENYLVCSDGSRRKATWDLGRDLLFPNPKQQVYYASEFWIVHSL